MIFQAMRCLIFILLVGLAGCDPGSATRLDEQRDPHYLNGRSRVSSQDYKGAIEEFTKALEANPRSASAHFELAVLNEEQIKDYAAAIYHYEQHLRLRPDSDYASRAKEHIRACKMDLAKTELYAPVNQGIQRDLDRLNAENLLLKRQIEALQTQLATQQSAPPPVNYRQPEPVSAVQSTLPVADTRTPSPTPQPQRPRVHIVQSGDTITSVAAKYGVPLSVFMKANSGVDPRRLMVGQKLVVPQ